MDLELAFHQDPQVILHTEGQRGTDLNHQFSVFASHCDYQGTLKPTKAWIPLPENQS